MTDEVGLGRVSLTMGSNFGDIDNDGYLDVYFGTGRPNYSTLTPNVMLKNVGGLRFADISVSSGTAHLQKGHGVSFADWDADGDLDLFEEMGGAVAGRPGAQRPLPEPGSWAPLAGSEARRRHDQSRGHRCPAAGQRQGS